MKKAYALLQSIASSFSFFAGLLLLIVVVLTVADVLSRSMFNASILGTIDISTLLLVAIVFLGLASAEMDGRHVSVNLLEANCSRSKRNVFNILRVVLLTLLAIVMAWGLFGVLLSAIDRSETTNGILRLPTWPAKLVLLGAFSFYFIVAIFLSVSELFNINNNRKIKDYNNT